MSGSLAADGIRKSIVVDCHVGRAFDFWTKHVTAWWPAGHSLSGRSDIDIFFEEKAGGRFYERTAEGVEYDWGRVVIWDPPQRLVYDWYLGSDREHPSRVDISFTEQEDGQTRVDVQHRGDKMAGHEWVLKSPRFGRSWDVVLKAFAEQT